MRGCGVSDLDFGDVAELFRDKVPDPVSEALLWALTYVDGPPRAGGSGWVPRESEAWRGKYRECCRVLVELGGPDLSGRWE